MTSPHVTVTSHRHTTISGENLKTFPDRDESLCTRELSTIPPYIDPRGLCFQRNFRSFSWGHSGHAPFVRTYFRPGRTTHTPTHALTHCSAQHYTTPHGTSAQAAHHCMALCTQQDTVTCQPWAGPRTVTRLTERKLVYIWPERAKIIFCLFLGP